MSRPEKKPVFHSGKRFSELSAADKLRFIGKATLFFLSGGFVFPTMWID